MNIKQNLHNRSIELNAQFKEALFRYGEAARSGEDAFLAMVSVLKARDELVRHYYDIGFFMGKTEDA